MRLAVTCALVAALIVGFFACTIDVTDNKQPTVTVGCIYVSLGNGTVTVCPDAGDAGDAG